LKYGEAYVRVEIHNYEAHYQIKVKQGLDRKARQLGYKLVPVETASNV
jgi:hypothetical protein